MKCTVGIAFITAGTFYRALYRALTIKSLLPDFFRALGVPALIMLRIPRLQDPKMLTITEDEFAILMRVVAWLLYQCVEKDDAKRRSEMIRILDPEQEAIREKEVMNTPG